jgi:hypothetical protein
MSSPKRKRDRPRSMRERLAKAASGGFAAVLPILGILGLRANSEPPPSPPQADVAVSVTFNSGLPDANDPTSDLTAAGLQEQAKYGYMFNAEFRTKSEDSSKAASIIQRAFGPGSLPIEAALAIFMSLITVYARAVLEKLIDQSADKSAESAGKLAEKILKAFKKGGKNEQETKEIPSDLETSDFGHVLTKDAFSAVTALRRELSKQSPLGNEISSRLLSDLSGLSDNPVLEDLHGNLIVPPVTSVSEEMIAAFYKLVQDAPSPPGDSDQAGAVTRGLQDPAADTSDHVTQESSSDAAVPGDLYAILAELALTQDPLSGLPSVPGAGKQLNTGLAQDKPVVRAFQDPAVSIFEALLPELGKKDSEFLANYVRRRVADEALNYLVAHRRSMALQAILDAPISSVR